MRHRFPSPTTPRHGRNGCLAAVLVLAAALGAALTLTAPAAHASPPPSGSRWENTNTGLCAYDTGYAQSYTLGGCASAARFTRTDCGNRGGVYFCEYIDGSGRCPTLVTSLKVEGGNCVKAITQLWSDPLAGYIYNYWGSMSGNYPFYTLTTVGGAGYALLYLPQNEYNQDWAFLSG